jgi:hypothetical protein
MPSLSGRLKGLSLEKAPSETKSESTSTFFVLFTRVSAFKESSKREELKEMGDNYAQHSREARNLLESGKALVQEARQLGEDKEDLIADYDRKLRQLEMYESIFTSFIPPSPTLRNDEWARRIMEQHKLWILGNFGLKDKMATLQRLTIVAKDQSHQARVLKLHMLSTGLELTPYSDKNNARYTG